MGRDQLRPFEHRIIRFRGWVESWSQRRGGSQDVLLTRLSYVPYAPEQVTGDLDAAESQHLDHAWLRVPPGTSYGRMQRLDPVFGFARVGWYRRSDGSTDLGLRPVPSLAGGPLALDLRRLITSGDWAAAEQRLRQLRRQLQRSELVIFDPRTPAAAILTQLEQRLLPLVQANRAAVAAAPRRGPCRGPRSFADLLPRP